MFVGHVDAAGVGAFATVQVTRQRDARVRQASRAAVVVDLPQIVGYEAGFDSIRDNEYASQPSEFFDADEVFALSRRIEVIEAIEAAGLKVKP